jgi:multidrug efflux pump
MKFTDLFIRRPVLATVVSLFILVLGLRSIGLLPARQYPSTQNAVITISTTYFGADPSLVAGFITTPLETAIAQANGIDYMSSTSLLGMSTIQAYLRLNYDANKAMTEITAKVSSVLNQLPRESQQPVLILQTGESVDSMYMGFYSEVLTTNKITDYLIRVVQPKLQTVPGVQTAEILGERQFAMRAWLDPAKMAARNVTATDVSTALANNDFISAVGRTKGQMVVVELTAATGLHTVDEFRSLVVKSDDGSVVRLGDVANVTLGAENYDTAVSFDGKSAVFIGIQAAPTANLLAVAEGVRKVFPSIQQELPVGLSARLVYDATKYVNTAVHEVVMTILKALLIVTLVIFLTLGSARSVIIPTIAIPLSLIGSFFIMLVLGYTINLLTLLSLVLAIGLVVDDAIIVVENTQRHIEDGESPLKAAIKGARELAGPIIAISVVLIAVYIPIGFMGGLTGVLFTEFAYTLAGSVAISALIALTLSPMMSANFLQPRAECHKDALLCYITKQFDKLRDAYGGVLRNSLKYLPVIGVFAAVILISNYFLFITSKKELAPQEDQGIVINSMQAAPNASLAQTRLYTRQVFEQLWTFPEKDHTFQVEGYAGLNSGIAGLVLSPWDERKRTAIQLQPLVQQKLDGVAGLRSVAFLPPSLPGAGRGLPVQFVVLTTESYDRLNSVSSDLLDKARQSGMFMFVDSDLKIDKPQMSVELNRDMISLLGLTLSDVGNALSSMLGEGYVNYFSLGGRSYKVIPQVMQQERLNADQLKNYYITADGQTIPVSTVATLKKSVVPESINHFQQLNSATISGVPSPGVTLGQALGALEGIARQTLPIGYSVDYAGESRQFVQESSALVVTFFFALIIIFLALAALFESFRDPFIVLISVPMSVCGAMIFISLGVGGASLNIYTEVGLVTLIGLISKHGILIVQFANDQQRDGKNKLEAIIAAATIRLRPILMTTAATVLGVLPLVTATGAGAASRFNMGLVIMSGISIGTLFTLFVVPAMYLFLAIDRSVHKEDIGESEEIRDLLEGKVQEPVASPTR